ncbi:tellurite resistance TerB family protein [Amaricoccus macauensis]|uniref:tellurite resistance TerB family protein n=1 Tax=Amaricoccus macauensis TaxID=57001 RepID=UPI003C7D8EDD
MSFGNILGQIMQSGLGGSAPSQNRVNAARSSLGGNAISSIFSEIQNVMSKSGMGGGSGGQTMRGLSDQAGQWLQKDQVGGLSGAHVGGIGAVAGALFGGGLKGAAKGGALAVLGTLAISALRNAQSQGQGAMAGAGAPAQQQGLPDLSELETAVEPQMERLATRAMIAAAKSDGQIDQQELRNIFEKFDAETATAEEKQFLLEEINKPLDIQAIASEVRNQTQAAEVYAAALLAIHVDTDEERQFLSRFASALGLDSATVAELHRLTGADT